MQLVSQAIVVLMAVAAMVAVQGSFFGHPLSAFCEIL
jgi:hypothetical protein